MHSKPNEPTPEKRSKIVDFSKLNFSKLECSIMLNIEGHQI